MALIIPDKFVSWHLRNNVTSFSIQPAGIKEPISNSMRQRMVNRAGADVTSTVHDNKHLEGFRISDMTYRGDFKIHDPRGFTAYINYYGMHRLLLDAEIRKGEIITPCRWGKNGTSNILCPLNGYSEQTYQSTLNLKADFEKSRIKPSELIPGDVTTFRRNGPEFIFIGRSFLEGYFQLRPVAGPSDYASLNTLCRESVLRLRNGETGFLPSVPIGDSYLFVERRSLPGLISTDQLGVEDSGYYHLPMGSLIARKSAGRTYLARRSAYSPHQVQLIRESLLAKNRIKEDGQLSRYNLSSPVTVEDINSVVPTDTYRTFRYFHEIMFLGLKEGVF